MKRKVKHAHADILETPSVPLPTFGTGEVARILGVDIWRIQSYLDSPKYRISPTGQQLGTGRGSRRVFMEEDVYRLGVAEHLVRDGFSYKFVSNALQRLDDKDLLGPFDSEGQELDVVYVLAGGEDNLRMCDFPRNETIADLTKWAKSSSLYLLDINKIITEIQKRMKG